MFQLIWVLLFLSLCSGAVVDVSLRNFLVDVSATILVADSDFCYVATGNGTIQQRHLQTGLVNRTFTGLNGTISAMSVQHTLLVAASTSGAIRQWNMISGNSTVIAQSSELVSNILFDGSTLYTATTRNGTFLIAARASGNTTVQREFIGHNSSVVGMSVWNNQLVAASSLGLIAWNTATGLRRATSNNITLAIDTAFFDNNGTVFLGTSTNVRPIERYRLSDFTRISAYQMDVQNRRVTGLASIGATLYASTDDLVIRSWDTNTTTLRGFLPGHQIPLSSMMTNPTGLLISRSTSEVKIWSVDIALMMGLSVPDNADIDYLQDAPNGAYTALDVFGSRVVFGHLGESTILNSTTRARIANSSSLFAPRTRVTSVFFDGVDAYAGAETGELRRWNITHIKMNYTGHVGSIVSLQVFNNTSLVSAGTDHIKIWNMATGANTRNLTAYNGTATELLVRDQSLFSSSTDGTILRWNSTSWTVAQTYRFGSTVSSFCVVDGILIFPDGSERNVTTGFETRSAIFSSAQSFLVCNQESVFFVRDHINIEQYDRVSRSLVYRYQGHHLDILQIAVTTDSLLFSISASDALVWRIQTFVQSEISTTSTSTINRTNFPSTTPRNITVSTKRNATTNFTTTATTSLKPTFILTTPKSTALPPIDLKTWVSENMVLVLAVSVAVGFVLIVSVAIGIYRRGHTIKKPKTPKFDSVTRAGGIVTMVPKRKDDFSSRPRDTSEYAGSYGNQASSNYYNRNAGGEYSNRGYDSGQGDLGAGGYAPYGASSAFYPNPAQDSYGSGYPSQESYGGAYYPNQGPGNGGYNSGPGNYGGGYPAPGDFGGMDNRYNQGPGSFGGPGGYNQGPGSFGGGYDGGFGRN